jgi:hypothetical protein
VTTRSGRSVTKPLRYMQVTKVSKEDWKTEALAKAIKSELKMLFAELKALRCIKRAAIKAGTKILKSHMFVVEKYLANGSFDKMKARLVAESRSRCRNVPRQVITHSSCAFCIYSAGTG